LGNNNAYCQDNAISWIDWEIGPADEELLQFTREVVAVTRQNPVFRRRRFFSGGPIGEGGPKDVSWIRPTGGEMTMEDWGDPKTQWLGMIIPGESSEDVDERVRPNRGQTLLLLLNASNRAHQYALPKLAERGIWKEAINTAQ